MSQSDSAPAPLPAPRPAPDPSIAVAKRTLRAQIRARLAVLSEGECLAGAAAIASRLAALPEIARARVLLATLPHQGEPDLTAFLAAWLDGDPYRVLVVPRVAPGSVAQAAAPRLELWTLPRLDAVAPGPWGVPEPDPARGAQPAPPGLRIDVALVPGLAFDCEGGRLGRGGGFFDALLGEWEAREERPLVVGVCHDCQLVERVPRDARDRCVGIIATPLALVVRGEARRNEEREKPPRRHGDTEAFTEKDEE